MKSPIKTTGIKFILLAFTLIPFITGCPLSITLSEDSTNTLLYDFKTSANQKFSSLIFSFDETEPKDKSDLHIFDTLEIEKALLHTGFSKANATHTQRKSLRKTEKLCFQKISEAEARFLME